MKGFASCLWLRLLQGVGQPDEVLACVEAGVDLFEAFFPFQVTERGCALCFSFDISPDPERAGTGVVKCFNVIKLNIFNQVMRSFFFFLPFQPQLWSLSNLNNSLLTFTSTNLKKNQAYFKLYFNLALPFINKSFVLI